MRVTFGFHTYIFPFHLNEARIKMLNHVIFMNLQKTLLLLTLRSLKVWKLKKKRTNILFTSLLPSLVVLSKSCKYSYISSSLRNVNNKTKNNDRNKKIAATLTNIKKVKRRASLNVFNATKPSTSASSMRMRHRSKSIQAFEREQRALDDDFFYELKRHKKKQHKKNDGDSTSLELPPPVCTCPYFGDKPCAMMKPIEVKIITTSSSNFLAPERTGSHIHHPKQQQQQNESNQFISNSSNSISNTPSTMSLPTVQSSLNRVHRKQSSTKCNAIVTWDSRHSYHRRGSNLNGSTRTTLLTPTQPKSNTINATPLRRSATLRNNNNSCIAMSNDENSTSVTRKIPSSPCILQRATTIRSHHSRNSSVISRNSARHGRIIRLEQKATKVLGVVFFTFVREIIELCGWNAWIHLFFLYIRSSFGHHFLYWIFFRPCVLIVNQISDKESSILWHGSDMRALASIQFFIHALTMCFAKLSKKFSCVNINVQIQFGVLRLSTTRIGSIK